MLPRAYVTSSRAAAAISVALRHAAFFLALALSVSASASEAADVDNFFHLAPGSSERLPPKTRTSLLAAMVDFRAVQSGKAPVNARPDTDRPGPADGGTTYWSGPGYQLAVIKSLATLGGVDGYMYGPILDFSSNLIIGNDVPLSSVSFYSAEQLRALLSGD